MSFVFPSWETAFSPTFYEDAKAMLETALNKGHKPPVIQGRVEVVDLNMGTQPPTLTLLEIGDLSLDRFRGILRLGYQGDAWIEVRCRVQANPLSHNPNLVHSSTLPISTPLLASQPLLVPMTLRLSKLHLRAILILVVSASKGITLVFKNDPLQNVDVSSTFDSVEVIRGYLQQEIEGQLREMFREDLPGIIHRLSQRWFKSSGTAGHVETPYRDGADASSASPQTGYDGEDETQPYDPTSAPSDVFGPNGAPRESISMSPRRRPSRVTPQRPRQSSVALSESPTSYTVFPDIENYDPTYGLRPEGLPTHSGYEAFGRLWEKNRSGGRGLGSLMDGSGGLETLPGQDDTIDEDAIDSGDEDNGIETGEESDDGIDVFDVAIERTTSGKSHRSRNPLGVSSPQRSRSGSVEWETFPAVGGGVVTRPRVYHSQSQIRAPSEGGFGGTMPSPAGTAGTAGTAMAGSVTARASSIGASSTVGSISARPQSVVGLLNYRQASPTAPLRRTMTAYSETLGNRGRSDSLATYAIQHSHALAHPQVPSPSSPMRSQPGSRRGVISPPPTTKGHASHNSWDMRSQRGPSFNPNPSMHDRAVSLDHGARLRSNTAPSPTRHRTTSFGTVAGTALRAGPGGITMPLNNSVSQLATLSLSANTLSPYARAHEHIAVRSFPFLGRTGSSGGGAAAAAAAAAEGGAVKARRKRIFRIGGESPSPASNSVSSTPATDSPDSRGHGHGHGHGHNHGRNRDRDSLSPEVDDTGLKWDEETRPTSSSGESARWRVRGQPPSSKSSGRGRGVRKDSAGSYGFPNIPE